MKFDPVATVVGFFPSENRRYPLIGGALLVLAAIFGVFAVMGKGYLPTDDTLRHAAQAVCQKPWHEILVTRGPRSGFDMHEGWTRLLFLLADNGMTAEGLVCFSYVFFFLVVIIPPLFLAPRSEAWVLALVTAITLGILDIVRLMCGRPFLGQVAAILVIGFLVERFEQKRLPWFLPVFLFVFMTLTLYSRTTWQLFILPLGCLLLAGKWRAFWRMSAIWLLASATAATLCWNWPRFFFISYKGVIGGNTPSIPKWALVSELAPMAPSLFWLLPVLVFLGIRWHRNEDILKRLRDPMLILTVVSWIATLKIARLWADFGIPALLVWLTMEITDFLDHIPALTFDKKARLGVMAVTAGVIFLLISADVGGRWGRSNYKLYADYSNPEIQEWFPDEGGIFYNTDMRFFYSTFFHNPHGHWKYNLGMEPSGMLPENRDILYNLWLYNFDTRLYQGYIDKMTEKDRLVILGGGQPGIKELEWQQLQTGIWSGRLPREHAEKLKTQNVETEEPKG